MGTPPTAVNRQNDRQTDRQTRLKTSHSRKLRMRAVKKHSSL